MHLRWGNYEDHCDVPLAEIIDIAFTARPATISFEAANPRYAYEWTLFEQIKLPDGKPEHLSIELEAERCIVRSYPTG